MNDNHIIIPYQPRDIQLEVHENLKRFNVIVAHRRLGKTVLCVNELIKEALSSTRRDWAGAYIAPLRNQSKRVAWDYCKYYSEVVPGVKTNESELKINYPNGSCLYLFGADNPDAIRGIGLDAVVLDETAQMKRRLWDEVVRPLLVDRNGWAIFIGTPAGRNFFYHLYQEALQDKDWFTCLFKASDTNILNADDLEQARMHMSLEAYQQEFECSFAAGIKGAYYSELLKDSEEQGRIGNVPYNPELPVYTAWDLGVSDSTVIWWYQWDRGGSIRFIDYHQDEGKGLDHYIKILKEKPYTYERHYLPHDVKQREFGTGKSPLKIAEGLGVKFEVVPKLSVQDGINTVRFLLPRCWFDKSKCWTGLEALRHYKRDYNELLDVPRDKPVHDWCSHPADAFRYFAVSFDEEHHKEKDPVTRRPKQTKAKMNYAVLESAADR